MSLIQHQAAFCQDVARLIQFAVSAGLVPRLGEAWRPPEMQEIYYRTGRSRTLQSKHQDRLAVDLVFSRSTGSRYAEAMDREDLEPLGMYWESLSPLNKWGGYFTVVVYGESVPFYDGGHFERRP